MQKYFTHFLTNFLRVIWNFKAIFLDQFLLIVIGAVPIALVEKIPFGDALYFAFVTGLTIGYGDIVMKTTLGRCVGLLIGFTGVLFTGLVIAAAVRAVQETYRHDGE